MAIWNFESMKTHQAWCSVVSPAFLLLIHLALSLVALLVTIINNAIPREDNPLDDIGKGFEWGFILPWPAVGVVWTAVDIIICRYWVLHPIYTIVASICMAAGWLAFGIITLLFTCCWSTMYIPAIFFCINAVFCFVVLGFAGRAVDVEKKQKQNAVKISNLESSS